ncbi:FecR family protein [Flagellimonas allohymeniacidonis]|uniref:FecR family protein n=1 Tax=Flagellimonas allohymeniacidonis TaxID=2517819 RepID=A0A4V2HSZ0_9FLAO|nr:FecR domain-containing protein [Allomuricauda hymeniacidonis]TAI49620.1 FecR family protein [Allomuricauda hymeniacidonis]
MQENYLAKWLNGDLSEDELKEFMKSEEYASYQRLKEVSSTLRAPEFEVETALQQLKQERIGEAPKVIALQPYKKFLRVAAAVAVLMVGSYFYLNLGKETFSAELAQQTEVTLPDNSEILLNADSKVTFNERTWDKTRKVSLKGEAFFKVAKGKTFTVSTSQGSVTVLGTQFNVENRKGFFEVTCYEGLVSVSYKDTERKLHAGTSFMVVDGRVVDASQPTTSTPSWMNNESSFERIPLKFVFEELERQYDITVKTENVDQSLLFTGTFSNTDMKMALKSISAPSRIKFKQEGDNVLFYAENTP